VDLRTFAGAGLLPGRRGRKGGEGAPLQSMGPGRSEAREELPDGPPDDIQRQLREEIRLPTRSLLAGLLLSLPALWLQLRGGPGLEEDPTSVVLGLASLALGLFAYAWYRRHPLASLRPHGIEIHGPVRGVETILYTNIARWRLTRHWLILRTVEGRAQSVSVMGASRELRRRIRAVLPAEAEGAVALPLRYRTSFYVVGLILVVALVSGS